MLRRLPIAAAMGLSKMSRVSSDSYAQPALANSSPNSKFSPVGGPYCVGCLQRETMAPKRKVNAPCAGSTKRPRSPDTPVGGSVQDPIIAAHHAARQNDARYSAIVDAKVVPRPLPSGGSIHEVTVPEEMWFIEPALPTLYDRTELYNKMWERVKAMEAGDRLLAIGNEGIGKSWSLNAMLWRHLKANPNDPVVVRDVRGWHFFDHDRCYREFDPSDARKLCDVLNALYPDERRVLLLHDCMTKSPTRFVDEDVSMYDGYAIVLASSPDSDNYSSFEKIRGGFHNFFMPMWSYEELSCTTPGITDAEFRKCGGVLRSYDETGMVSEAVLLKQRRELAVYPYAETEHVGLQYRNGSSSIVAYQPIKDHEDFVIDFVSEDIYRKWITTCKARCYAGFKTALVQLLSNNATRGGGAAYAFESYVHLEFDGKRPDPAKTTSRPSHWLLCPLEPPRSTVPALLTLPRHVGLPAQMVNDFSNVHRQSSGAMAYYLPEDSNVTSFDAVYVIGDEAWFIQTTIAAVHPVKAKGFKKSYDDLINNGFSASNIRIIFVTDLASGLHQRQQCYPDSLKKALSEAKNKSPVDHAEVTKLEDDLLAYKAEFDALPQYRIVISVNDERLLQLQPDALGPRSVWVPSPRSVQDMLAVYDGTSSVPRGTAAVLTTMGGYVATDAVVKHNCQSFHVA